MGRGGRQNFIGGNDNLHNNGRRNLSKFSSQEESKSKSSKYKFTCFENQYQVDWGNEASIQEDLVIKIHQSLVDVNILSVHQIEAGLYNLRKQFLTNPPYDLSTDEFNKQFINSLQSHTNVFSQDQIFLLKAKLNDNNRVRLALEGAEKMSDLSIRSYYAMSFQEKNLLTTPAVLSLGINQESPSQALDDLEDFIKINSENMSTELKNKRKYNYKRLNELLDLFEESLQDEKTKKAVINNFLLYKFIGREKERLADKTGWNYAADKRAEDIQNIIVHEMANSFEGIKSDRSLMERVIQAKVDDIILPATPNNLANRSYMSEPDIDYLLEDSAGQATILKDWKNNKFGLEE